MATVIAASQLQEKLIQLNPIQKRRFILWTIALIVGLSIATFLLAPSLAPSAGQGKLALIIGAAWLFNIFFNSYILDYLLHRSKM